MWRDSDLLCIGELQLLWIDKNSDQTLASLRLYFLPENTPDGRMDHGEDEVLAISEKVVIRVEDLITWITVEAEWTWGRLAKCEGELKNCDVEPSKCSPPRKPNGTSFALMANTLDFTDIDNERRNIAEMQDTGPHVIILSFPKYCRYRTMMKRLEGVEDFYLKHKIVNALGGFYVKHPNTRVLFCRDTFDYPELEGHELLCNHLAPKLKGRPRGKRKKRSVSPGSESNESESSVSNCYNMRTENRNGLRCNVAPRRSTRCHENNENKEFVRKLTAFMKINHTPIGRIPSLGYKELNLYEFFTKVQKLGGYDCVTTNRLWKSIFDDMSGHQNSTSAATVIRRHYERFLLPYERHMKGEEYKPPASERRRLKSKRGSNSFSDAESSGNDASPSPQSLTNSKKNNSSSSGSGSESKENVKIEGKPSSLRSIRVKTERQKDKKLTNEKDNNAIVNNNNNINSDSNKMESVNVTQKVEKLIIKTDSMTVKTECESPFVKIEYATMKIEPKPESPVKEQEEIIKSESPIKVEPTLVKSELEDATTLKIETAPVKTEINIEVKVEPIIIKDVEPLTSAVAPKPDNLISPIEGKENIPLIKTGDVFQHSVEVIEVPYKPKISEAPQVESSFRSTFIHEVKKRKLDILKEGGLEVTPVKPVKDSRPSVIHQVTPPVQVIPKPKMDVNNVNNKLNETPIIMPPPKRVPHILSTPVKKTAFPFVNGTTPPKVVQSKSIYTYSEKTVYGNPKDIWPSPVKPAVPKFVTPIPPKHGGDPVDLSVTSPSKPVVEIMRIPQISHTPYNRSAVTKNLYKTNVAPPPVVDHGRRLGPNLEITLVGGPNKHNNPPVHRHQYPNNHNHHLPPQKRPTQEYFTPNKLQKPEENGRYKHQNYLPPKPPSVTNQDITIPHPFKNPTTIKPETIKPIQQQQHPNIKPYTNPNVPPVFSPFISQLYDQSPSKSIPPYLPLLDPAVYYSAAMQSLYSNGGLNSAPILPIPTPDQLKLYADLMAQHGRLNYPFSLPQDGGKSNRKYN